MNSFYFPAGYFPAGFLPAGYFPSTQVPPPPAAPSGLAVGAITVNIPVSWNSVSGATAYRLYRSGTKVYDGPLLTCIDVMALGTVPSYTVSAYNANGEGVQAAPLPVPAVQGGGAYSPTSVVQSEIGSYGNPAFQPDPNAVYLTLIDGRSIERVGGGKEVGKVTYKVPGGTRVDRYDAQGRTIASSFVPIL